MHKLIFTLIFSTLYVSAHCAGMDDDPEVKALLARFNSMKASVVLQDDFNLPMDRRTQGPVKIENGSIFYPEDRSEAVYVYYSVVLPRRGCLSLDFRLDKMPKDHNFMTLCDAGTAGNTKFMVRLGMDRRVCVYITTRREQIRMISDPVESGKWHELKWLYAPEGSVLQIDGIIQDYSTDICTPYSVETGEAFYLGDQPWWDSSARKGIFYPYDSFVGQLDNLSLEGLSEVK